MRYFFEISYNGSRYHGWQNQANAVGVQQIVEDALSKLMRHKLEIVGSGRTDAGVHCAQQFFHADFKNELNTDELLHRLNSFLPKDIAIHSIFKVTDSAHARYDARQRSYEYHITTKKDPLSIGYAYYFFKPLDVGLMNRAAKLLIGEHDFTSFSKVKTDVNHFVCHVKKATWRKKNTFLVFEISANRFLRGMVRAIVGTLLDVGTKKISFDDFQEIIKGKDRKKAGMNVPPEGLFLVEVKYLKSIIS
ncbi:MAG TPA: tRNA pseudouridine(38-40) synthase TruA [Cyclobacteriaceae bacterium]|nr:tRNA pseudouridine(38-40) synthase TruA [Cyclobacteriaceae bacterium]